MANNNWIVATMGLFVNTVKQFNMSKTKDWFLSLFFDKITLNQQTGEGFEQLPDWWQKHIMEMEKEKTDYNTQPKTFTEEQIKQAIQDVAQMIEYDTKYKYWKNPMHETIKLFKQRLLNQ